MSDHLEIKEISVHAGMSDETDPLRVASVPDTQRNEGGIPRVQKSTEGRGSNDQPKNKTNNNHHQTIREAEELVAELGSNSRQSEKVVVP